MELSKLLSKHKNKILSVVGGLVLSGLSIAGTYIFSAVNYYEKDTAKKEMIHLIDSIILEPTTLQKVLTDSNVVKARKMSEEKLITFVLKDAVANKQPDSVKLSAKLKVEMDLKVSQKVEKEIGWMYRFCKSLEKAFQEKQGKPKKIRL